MTRACSKHRSSTESGAGQHTGGTANRGDQAAAHLRMVSRRRRDWSRRLSLLDVANDPSLYAEIDTALNAMRPFEEKPAAQDHLCCGNAGRIELLHLAGIRLGRPDLIARSRAYAEHVVARSLTRETYGAGSVDEGFAPSFLFGLAGIGYELLRLDSGERLPSLLIWE